MARNINTQNQLLKRKFLIYLDNSEGYSSLSIDKFERAMHLYELCYKHEDFNKFNYEKAIGYKEYLKQKGYAKSTYQTFLHHVKIFFSWLSKQEGFKRKIKITDIDYLNSSKKDRRLASQDVLIPFPTHSQVLQIFNSLPCITDVDLRNRALIAFTYCTGMRDKAISTLPCSVVDLENLRVVQDPRKGVDVKFSKVIYSKIFEYTKELILAIREWDKLLKSKRFQAEEPFFPKSKQLQMEGGLSYIASTTIDRTCWSSTVSVRKIFKDAATLAGVEYFSPHSFRHAAIYRAIECIKSFKELKAISQNFGHESVITILESYANFKPNLLLKTLDDIDVNRPEKMSKGIPQDLMKKLNETLMDWTNEYSHS